MITLILGGARSGKSRLAQDLASQYELKDKPVFYIATATCCDKEMADRIAHHKINRPSHWHTIEVPIYLADSIYDISQKPCVILVDCLTLWVNNLLLAEDKTVLNTQIDKLLHLLSTFHHDSELILVSNETGLGVIPMGQLTRQFVDESGFLHQKIAKIADKVLFCVAGIAMTLKDETGER